MVHTRIIARDAKRVTALFANLDREHLTNRVFKTQTEHTKAIIIQKLFCNIYFLIRGSFDQE